MVNKLIISYRNFGWLFAFWTLIATISVGQAVLSTLLWNEQLRWGEILFYAVRWYFWAGVTPFVMFLARKFALHTPISPKTIFIHISIGLALAFVLLSIETLYTTVWGGFVWTDWQKMSFVEGYGHLFKKLLGVRVFVNFLVYLFILGVTHAFDFYRNYQDEKIRASRLESRLTEARLEALKMQLQPHFLFNALHAVNGLVLTHRNEDASQMISRLSDLLRGALDPSRPQLVRLKEEWAFLRLYLDVQQIRFGDRLKIVQDIPDDLCAAEVPYLILQPLVENALKHGIEPYSEAGTILIRARKNADELILEVCDDGKGLKEGLQKGIGLSNTEERLRELYGHKAKFEITNATDHVGVCATVILPLKF